MAETGIEDLLNAPPPADTAFAPSATVPDFSEKQEGQLVIDNNYTKSDSDAPPRRGRGRPPKAKTAVPAGDVVASPPRPRGRPPKPRDPFAEPPPPKAAPSGRPRGRPPKKAKTSAAPPPASTTGGAPRGRGRPPKVKPAVEPVAV